MAKLTNYIAFVNPETGLDQIGHLDLEENIIQPLSFLSGTPVKNLYQVIEVGSPDELVAAGSPIPAGSTKILPPISGRDVLAVGKNYMEHAKEFNSSGYDASDKVDRPSHPVIFTKRATSIIANGEDILLHEDFTSTADYEGEIGVILGMPGFRVKEQDAWDHVWGYTIINDVTARERQRDHKQFYIGKSADTYCPIGPIAVPKEDLPETLRVQTHVNGELRQDSTIKDLIFPIPELLTVMSAGQTLQPGDVIATGTPAGVGIGRKPPVFLKPGDEISISVTGLGTLTNKVAKLGTVNNTLSRVLSASAFELTNAAKTAGKTAGLTVINGKPISYQQMGSGSENIVFVHGLGGTKEYWTPLISTLSLDDSATLHLYDFEGHGLSPTHPLSQLTIESLAADLASVFQTAGISASAPATLIAQSAGCLVAMRFTLENRGLVKKLVLMSPPPTPLPKASSDSFLSLATLARTKGMAAVADAAVDQALSSLTKQKNPLAIAATRLSLLGQDPEAYAKACHAFAGASTHLGTENLEVDTLIIAGQEDKAKMPAILEQYKNSLRNTPLVMLKKVGLWPVFEDIMGVARAFRET
ncbi:hypothetical protein FHL15_007988 [Xylaria flabelliformis]|uniref:AB hydrolase-1 domain-containing protein n=1 Tax=Xylaria flabelliformis TaxID=2512241 RepID=A0A553HTB6_9PEZI|nr:hypothetical protein FHL15_007988 [Xylaria flabelliformis]